MLIPDLDADILFVRVAGFLQAGQERAHGGAVGGVGWRARAEQADLRNPNGRLRVGGERRGEEAEHQNDQEDKP